MAHSYTYFDGAKAINLNDLPEEAWQVIVGSQLGDDELRTLYTKVAFLYRCVEVRANALSNMPWAITQGDSDVWLYDAPEVPEALEPLEDLPDLLWRSEAALVLGAQAFWFKNMSRGDRLLELRWFKPETIKPIWSDGAGLMGFERTLPNRAPIALGVDDIVWLWLKGQHETKPRSPAAMAAMHAAGAIYSTDIFVKGFFDRGAIKATLLRVPANTSEGQRKELKAWWQRMFEGVAKSWQAHVVSAEGVEPVVIGEGIQELTNTELTTSMREDIATALGVPHSLVLSNAANFATANQDSLNFYDQTIVPEARIIQRQLNKQLFEPLGYRFEFRPQEMSIYQEDEEQRSQSLANLTNAGVPLALAMQILGYDLPEGVTYETLEQQLAEERQAALEQAQAAMANARPPGAMQRVANNGDGGNEPDEMRQDEVRKLKRWAKGKRDPDPAHFKSDILSDADKREILGLGDGAADDAPFPAAWGAYPGVG